MWISMGIAALSGLVAGSAFGGALLALGLPTRVVTMFGGSRRACGWAVTAGAGPAALMYMAGLSVPLGAWAGWVLLLLGGAFVGMLSAALAELLELLPALLVNARVAGMVLPAVVALMLGKAVGAVVAAMAAL